MDARHEKAKLLAHHPRIKHVEGAMWFCPSQTSNEGGYLVNILAATCTCPDHELRRCKCKHQIAVELTRTVERAPDGSTVTTETVKVTRKTYSQKWPAYNASQCEEKAVVQGLLRSLCDGIEQPAQTMGRPRMPLADAVYGMAMKVYGGMSARRSTTDIEASMVKAPRYNTLLDYFDKPELTPLLSELVEQSAAPLAALESQFAVDSTGFATSVYRRWYDAKYGREMKEHAWLKAHAMVGCRTNVITSVRVTTGNVNDCPELAGLVSWTAKSFTIAEVSADKAYLSRENLTAIEEVGATPYIPLKSNSKAEGPAAWRRLWGLFVYRSEEFLAHYHQRSNVESTFSAVKRKFGGAVRSKRLAAQMNEVLLKCLCHNLSMLCHAIREFGIEAPTFTAAPALAAS